MLLYHIQDIKPMFDISHVRTLQIYGSYVMCVRMCLLFCSMMVVFILEPLNRIGSIVRVLYMHINII